MHPPDVRAVTLAGRSAECARLDRLLLDVRAGRSEVLVLRGGSGIGKTALLDHAVQQASGYRIIRALGVESETELAFAGLHLLCAPLLDGLGSLPTPQRDALQTAIGLSAGSRPDRFLLGLATLGLLADAAAALPLLCILDDAQWLDRSSAQVLAFVARRLDAESIAVLFAERETPGLGELDGLPEMRIRGLSNADAKTVLRSALTGPLDENVGERIVAETRGNPLALLELRYGMSAAELAGGFGVNTARQLPTGIEESLWERVEQLPSDSRRLLLAAAAEPTGDPTLQWRAAAELGISTGAAASLESSGLLSLGHRVTFRHPLLRSAIYSGAPESERRIVHRALAKATDPEVDPDRRAWHRAHAAEGPDEEIARELEASAVRAQGRGGLAATAAFLEKAVLLTPDPVRRPERALAAASAMHEVGAADQAFELLVIAESGPEDLSRSARVQRLRARVAFTLSRGGHAAEMLMRAAQRLEPVQPELARETYLEALAAAIFAGRLVRHCGPSELAEAARAGPPAAQPPRAIDLLLDGLVLRFTKGYAAAVDVLKRALEALLADFDSDEAIRWFWLACRIAGDQWDDESWHELTMSELDQVRGAGVLSLLPYALTYRAIVDVFEGRFNAASSLIDEADAVARSTATPQVIYTSLVLAAWRGREGPSIELFEAARAEARDRGEGMVLTTASYAAAVLYNGLGRYEEAFVAAGDALELDELGLFGWTLVEYIEAAVRSDKPTDAADAFQRLSERTRPTSTDWGRGIEAVSRALVVDDRSAEDLYLEAVERLGRCRIAVHLGRAQLLYGEWLRRRGRRVDARGPLRAAHQLFTAMGAEAFAGRAQREFLATGASARCRTVETRVKLTPQEGQIARLARDGLSNPEIGARLFISPRTVEYHLHKLFDKLDITSRMQLHLVLPDA